MSTANLVKQYDRIATTRAGLEAELELDVSGEGRRARLEQIADALIEGKPIPDVRFDRNRADLELAGCGVALKRTAYALAGAVGEARPEGINPRLPELAPTGEQMEVAIDLAYDAAEQSQAATEAKLDERQRYDKALDNFQAKRAELIEQGIDPLAASERAKQALGAQADDLWPEGSAGTLQLTGRNLAETVMA